jgi:hypothetical protein
MSKGNSEKRDLIGHLAGARDALDAALKLLQAEEAAPKKSKPKNAISAAPKRDPSVDFTTPLRPSVKKRAGGMNGAKKFTLLLAYLTKGDSTKTVALSDIEAQWNRMTGKGLLGVNFNRLYSSEARDNDWVSAEKAGAYRLRPSWKEIFNG